jgi:hypothetical protein
LFHQDQDGCHLCTDENAQPTFHSLQRPVSFFWTLEQLWIKQWHVHASRLTLPSKQSHLHLRLADGENSQTAPKTNGMIEFIDLRNPLLDSQSNYNLDTRVMN